VENNTTLNAAFLSALRVAEILIYPELIERLQEKSQKNLKGAAAGRGAELSPPTARI